MKLLASLLFTTLLAVTMAEEPPECYTNLDDISWAEYLEVPDPNVPREYILCPDTDFLVGIRDTQTGEFQGGSFAMTVRKGSIIKCGQDGKRSNNCRVTQGSLGLLVLAGIFENFGEFIDGVEIHGVTFDGLRDAAMSAESWGHVKLIDCAFVNNRNIAPVLLQYDGNPSGTTGFRRALAADEHNKDDKDAPIDYTQFHYHVDPPKMFQDSKKKPALTAVKDEHRELDEANNGILTVDFIGCDFDSNEYAIPNLPGVVTILYDAMDINFNRCNFSNNIYANPEAALTWIILNNDNAGLTLENTCFTDNDVFGRAPVTTLSSEPPKLENNWGTEEDDVLCQFVSNQAALGDQPNCIDYDADMCLADEPTPAPTSSPTAPTTSPTSSPTAPTASPTDSPTRSPVDPPTDPPVDPPTDPPVDPPTSPPVEPPTEPPTAPKNPPTAPPVAPPSSGGAVAVVAAVVPMMVTVVCATMAF